MTFLGLGVGSWADWFSAFGTILAVCVSLYLLHNNQKISAYVYSTNYNGGNKYDWKSDVCVINPSNENYFVVVKTINLIISGKNYSYILDAIIDSHHPSNIWPKYYVTKAGEDTHLFKIDWAIIYSKLDANNIPIRRDECDCVKIELLIGSKTKTELEIYAPENYKAN